MPIARRWKHTIHRRRVAYYTYCYVSFYASYCAIAWNRAIALYWTFALLSLGAMAGLLATPAHAQEFVSERPNILLILTDDQGWPTLGSYGGKLVKTPNLDALAQQGARFTDAYVTSQCTPTRASLLTGQYTARHGLWHVLRWYGYPYARVSEPVFAENFSRETFTLGKALQMAGYRTAIVGKWHLTSDADGSYMGLSPSASHHYGFDYAPPVLTQKAFEPGADRGVEELTNQALEFIEQNRAQPWFCFLSHHMIHGKVVAPNAVTEKYQKLGYGDEGPNRAVYLAGLECIDRSVGRLMERLSQLQIADNTLVIFLSDNGGIDEKLAFREIPEPHPAQPRFAMELTEYSNAPLRAGKGSVYEGGVRVPWIMRWPAKISAGTVIEAPVHVIDLMPTLMSLAGAEAQATHELDGANILPMLANDDQQDILGDRALFQYYPFYDLRWGLTPCASIRKGDYKLIEFFGDRVTRENRYDIGQRIELYDLQKDLGERNNLSSANPILAKALSDELHQWMEEIGAEFPAANMYFDRARAFFETREKPPWLQGAMWSRTTN